MKPKKKSLQTKVERLWEEVCKLRDKECRSPRACSDECLQVHHVISRGSKVAFVEIINGVLLCKSCHFLLHHNDGFRMAIEDMVRKKEGKAFEKLRERVKQGGPFLEWGKIGWLTDKIKELEHIKKGLEDGIYG